MNAEPHTHEVRIKREYGSAGGHLLVVYGDTVVSTRRWWQPPGCFYTNHPSDKRIRWARDKAIKRHDEGSRRAGEEAARLAAIATEVDLADGQWGSA